MENGDRLHIIRGFKTSGCLVTLRSKLLGQDLRPLLFGDVQLTEDELQQDPFGHDKGAVCWVGVWVGGLWWNFGGGREVLVYPHLCIHLFSIIRIHIGTL